MFWNFKKIFSFDNLIRFFIFGLLFYLLFNQGVTLYQKQENKKLSDDYNQEFERAILWFKENTSQEDIILSEWTQGHQIVALTGRRVVATSKVYPSEAKETAERYKDIGRFFFADSEKEAIEISQKYGANFIFVPRNFDWWLCRSINRCDYQGGTIIDRMLKGDEFNNLVKVYQSAIFLIFKTKENNQPKLFAGFPEDYFSKIFNSDRGPFLSKFNQNAIYGAILPHHLEYAGQLVNEFFKNLASHQKIKTLILLGPDHFNNNGSSITTTDLVWETPWGEISPDLKIIKAISEKGLAAVDNQVNEKEHALKVFIPFVKYYFPEIKVVPIIFKDDTSDEEVQKLARQLKQFVGPQTPILVSADFAHRLSLNDTNKEDEKSLAAIKNFDLTELKTSQVDAKPAISLFLSAMRDLGVVRISILNHSNSLDLLKMGAAETEEKTVPYLVSYFFISFNR